MEFRLNRRPQRGSADDSCERPFVGARLPRSDL